jgi:cytidine deaminase
VSAKKKKRSSMKTEPPQSARLPKAAKAPKAPKAPKPPKAPKAPKAPKPVGLSATHVPAALLDQLVQEATAVRERAYAPYSGYLVGAAILTRRGVVYAGCNVENSTFGATICAERGAIMQMVAHGDDEPIACAVVTRDGGSPCGICRQVLAEFARDMPIVLVGLASPEGESGTVVQLKDLLPLAFRLHT